MSVYVDYKKLWDKMPKTWLCKECGKTINKSSARKYQTICCEWEVCRECKDMPKSVPFGHCYHAGFCSSPNYNRSRALQRLWIRINKLLLNRTPAYHEVFR